MKIKNSILLLCCLILSSCAYMPSKMYIIKKYTGEVNNSIITLSMIFERGNDDRILRMSITTLSDYESLFPNTILTYKENYDAIVESNTATMVALSKFPEIHVLGITDTEEVENYYYNLNESLPYPFYINYYYPDENLFYLGEDYFDFRISVHFDFETYTDKASLLALFDLYQLSEEGILDQAYSFNALSSDESFKYHEIINEDYLVK